MNAREVKIMYVLFFISLYLSILVLSKGVMIKGYDNTLGCKSKLIVAKNAKDLTITTCKYVTHN